MNDQRMVSAKLLKEAIGLLSTVYPPVIADKLRTIIDGPGVEPVALPDELEGLAAEAFAMWERSIKPKFYDWTKREAVAVRSAFKCAWWAALQTPSAPVQADYEEVLASHRRLVRELDVLINGSGAAKQASLCDIVSQVKREGLVVPVQAVPDGWQLVPKEVTQEMFSAMRTYYFTVNPKDGGWPCGEFVGAYKAALAAAPQPPKESTAQSVAADLRSH